MSKQSIRAVSSFKHMLKFYMGLNTGFLLSHSTFPYKIAQNLSCTNTKLNLNLLFNCLGHFRDCTVHTKRHTYKLVFIALYYKQLSGDC